MLRSTRGREPEPADQPMRRDKNLVLLSHQHHNALALCVCIERSLSPEYAGRWQQASAEELQADIEHQFQNEIQYHFDAEERVLFPAARLVPDLVMLVDELRAEHAVLRGFAARAQARQLTTAELQTFAGALSAHVRKEERQLFEAMQARLSPEKLARTGEELDAYFRSSGMPGAACRLR